MQAERADPQLVRRDRLNSCHLSSADLQPPIIADYLGNLFSKPSMLEFLLARDHGRIADVEAQHRYSCLCLMRDFPVYLDFPLYPASSEQPLPPPLGLQARQCSRLGYVIE